jgi:hypothetical protein
LKIFGFQTTGDSDSSRGTTRIHKDRIEQGQPALALDLATASESTLDLSQLKLAIQVQKICENGDDVFVELMLRNARLFAVGKWLNLDTNFLDGAVSAVNMEGESFCHETMDLNLRNFFRSGDSSINIWIDSLEEKFPSDELPNIRERGEYRYSVALQAGAHSVLDKLVLGREGSMGTPIGRNNEAINFSADEFSFDKDSALLVSGQYRIE